MAKITYLAQIDHAYYIDPRGVKQKHIKGFRPTANDEISKIHSAHPEAVVVLTQSNNQSIQIATGSTMSDAAKQTLLAELDKWARDLSTKSYYSAVAEWTFAMSKDNRVCVIQPPAKDKITDEQINSMEQSISQWIDNFVNAPAQQPNPGTGTGGGTQAPAQQPNPGTGTGGQPNPGTGTGGGTQAPAQPNPGTRAGGAQAPADPLEGFTSMQREGYEKTLALIEKINRG